jgi:hypothetical protein
MSEERSCWWIFSVCRRVVVVESIWICVNVNDDYVYAAWRVRAMFVSMEFLNLFSYSLKTLSLNLLRKPQKESQNSIHIKIMYRRIYDFK